MRTKQIQEFLAHLAVERNAAASIQNLVESINAANICTSVRGESTRCATYAIMVLNFQINYKENQVGSDAKKTLRLSFR